jgi:hypothetical protein
MRDDLRDAARMLRTRLGFAVAALLTLAVGIGCDDRDLHGRQRGPNRAVAVSRTRMR